MNLLLAIPSYGLIYPEAAKSVRRAMMDLDINWVDDISMDRYAIPVARNKMVDAALTYRNVDGVIWVDDDMRVDRGTFRRLASQGYDLLSALSFTRRVPHYPIMWGFDRRRILNYPPDTIIQPAGVGFGCVYTSIRLLQSVGTNPFGEDSRGEDWDFCQRAYAHGFGTFVDTGVRCGHYGEPKLITEETFLLHNSQSNVDPPSPPDWTKHR